VIRNAALVLAALWSAVPPQLPPPAPTSIIVGTVREYQVARGDTWTSVGARAGVAPSTLARRNGRSLDTPLRESERITIDARHIVPANPGGVAILVNLPQRLLFHFRDTEPVVHFPVAVGRRDWATPTGPFTIRIKEENPTWDVPISIQEEMRREGRRVLTTVPPGPDNPLGRHWLGLSLPGVGIHGTNAPSSVYRATTHGCMRMHPDDVAVLFDRVREGDAGRTVYEPVLVAVTADGRIFLEVHPDIYRRVPDALDLANHLLERAGVLAAVNRDAVRRAVAARDGIAVDLARTPS
jgi:L,D-transpeptidase ErfK/SrfK